MALLLIALSGCVGVTTSPTGSVGITVRTDDLGWGELRGVRDTTAADGLPAKSIECATREACWNLAAKLCREGYKTLQPAVEKSDGALVMVIRCK